MMLVCAAAAPATTPVGGSRVLAPPVRFAFLAAILAFICNAVLVTAATGSSSPAPRVVPIPFQKQGPFANVRKKQHDLRSTRRHVNVANDGNGIQGKVEARPLELRASKSRPAEFIHQLLENKGILYLANVTVGTPPQPLQLQIDTASSDIWVLSKSVSACYNPTGLDLWSASCSFGSFNPDASSTFKLIGQDRFSILYSDGTGAQGDYAEDTFCVGGVKVVSTQIGVATTANLSYGIMGVGFDADQASVTPGGMGQYSSLLNEMVKEGLINSKAYSLWLDDLNADTGSILFGGIDTERFIGELTSIPIAKAPGQVDPLAFTIPLTSVAFANTTSHVNLTSKYLPASVILDSGSSLTFLPHSLAWGIANQTGAKISHDLGLFIIDCNYPTKNSFIKYTISYVLDIRVPLSEIILPLTKFSEGMVRNMNGSDICALGIVPSPGKINLFGDTFLRSAYVVYDLDNQRVAMAQTNFEPVGQNLLEIGSGQNSVPSVGVEAMTIMATSTLDATNARSTTKSAAATLYPVRVLVILPFIILVLLQAII
ncbi:Candidapepsin [Arthrobotrys entomopaga]|nr:Candidapepsin [Arthrobotrys entomopaga]